MKHYRIVGISPVVYQYPVVQFYGRNPGLQSAPYAVQQDAFFQGAYVYSDSFSRAMRLLGHEACEIIYDLEILQKTWAKENGVTYDTAHWQTDIVCAQLKAFKPDVIYLQGLGVLPLSVVKGLKEKISSLRLIVQYTCYPGAFKELKDVDVLFAGTPTMVRQYRDAGFQPQLLYHSFDEAILKKIHTYHNRGQSQNYDFTFVGSSGFAQGLSHQARYWFLLELINRTNIELWIDEESGRSDKFLFVLIESFLWNSLVRTSEFFDLMTLNKLLSSKVVPDRVKRTIRAIVDHRLTSVEQKQNSSNDKESRLPQKPLLKMFPNRCHAPVFGLDMYKVLSESKVTFNRHTDAAIDSVGNMRMFQATGVGTCLLTDSGKNMSDLFEEDREVVTYTTIEECIEKAKYLLEHEDVRQQIAITGQKRTLRGHTILNRCRQIDETIQKRL